MAQAMTTATVGPLRRFWRWWMHELAAVFAVGDRSAPVDVIVTTDGARFLRLDPGSTKLSRAVARADNADAWASLSAFVRTRPQATVAVRLPPGSCFVRRVDAPAGAVGDLTEMLSLDLERATPFSPRDVCQAHYVDDAPTPSGALSVRHVLAPRALVETALANVRSVAANVVRIDSWNDHGDRALPVDFLPTIDGAKEADRARFRFAPLAAAVAAALAILAPIIAFQRLDDASQTVAAALAAESERARQERIAVEAVEGRLAATRRVAQMASDRVAVVRLIDELSRALPDSAHLTEMRIGEGEIAFSGLARQAAELPAALQRPPLFADATFSAPVVRDAGGDGERFSLRLSVGAGKAPATGVEDGEGAIEDRSP